MSRPNLYLLLGAILAVHAGFWFLSGVYGNHSNMRNFLVIIQAMAGLGLMYWAVKNKPVNP